MTDNEIRVQYSGFIIFAAKMLSVATGIIFTLLLTRNTTSGEYGIWSNVFDLMGYFMLLSGALPFWTTRFVARGKEGAGKTGFFANLVIAVISVAIYLPLISIVTGALNVSVTYLIVYVIAAMQIIELYLINGLEAILRAKKPQAVGYGLLIEEVFKVSVASLLIARFQQPLLGAMLGLIFGVFIQIVYYARLTSRDFKQKIQWSYVREWVKGSIATIYNTLGNQIAAFIFILLFIYGGHAARGDYQAAATIANIITYAFFLSFALYPKLLAETRLEDVTTSLKMVLMFALPMTAVAIAIPDSFLVILDEQYAAAAPVLFLLAVDALLMTLSQFYTYVLFGVERLDEEAKIPLKQLAQSDIFKVFTLPYIHSAITLPTAFYVLTNFAANQPVLAATYVTVINMVTRFAMFLVLYVYVRRSVRLPIPWRSIGKYVFASAVVALALYVLPHPTKLFQTVVTAAAGGVIYLALLASIDKEARALLASILREIVG